MAPLCVHPRCRPSRGVCLQKHLDALPDPRKAAKRPKAKDATSPGGKEGTPGAKEGTPADLEELRPRKMAPKKHALEEAGDKPESPAKKVSGMC